MVVFAAVRKLTEVEADECDGLDLKIVPGKRDQNYMCMNTPGTLFVAHVSCNEDEVCTVPAH